MVRVVTHENPFGSSCTYCMATSRRNARRPEFRSLMSVSLRKLASLRMTHLAGVRNHLRVPSSVWRQPTMWSKPCMESTSSGIKLFG